MGGKEIRPCLIQGVMQRTGTNWVYDLIHRTGCYGSIGPIWENNFLSSWGLYDRASCAWVSKWAEGWVKGDELLDHHEELGVIQGVVLDGLLRYLQSKCDDGTKPFLSKCPNGRTVAVPAGMGEKVDLIVVVRNPVDLITSGMTAFGWSVLGAVDNFNHATASLRPIVEKTECLVVTFEDMKSDWESAASEVFNYTGIPSELRNTHPLPVRGQTLERGKTSSWSSREQQKLGVSRKINLNPLQRWMLIAGTADTAEFWGYQQEASGLSRKTVYFILRLRSSLKWIKTWVSL